MQENINKTKPNSRDALNALQDEVESLIQPLGYEVVALEMNTGGGRTLRLYIDFANNDMSKAEIRRISLEDCVTVNRAVDELLENTPLIEGSYTLEVSSPGVERPLRKASDYNRFSGHKARVSTFRPLTAAETGDEAYTTKNPKQKNFIGELKGLSSDGKAVCLKPEGYAGSKAETEGLTIPLELVSKAHLEYVEPSESPTPDRGESLQ